MREVFVCCYVAKAAADRNMYVYYKSHELLKTFGHFCGIDVKGKNQKDYEFHGRFIQFGRMTARAAHIWDNST